MKWIKPEFKEISLCMEVTAYVNTDQSAPAAKPAAPRPAELTAPASATRKVLAD